ncbi:MAG: hypothetical protein QM667_02945 [Asticcacaulis sp.]
MIGLIVALMIMGYAGWYYWPGRLTQMKARFRRELDLHDEDERRLFRPLSDPLYLFFACLISGAALVYIVLMVADFALQRTAFEIPEYWFSLAVGVCLMAAGSMAAFKIETFGQVLDLQKVSNFDPLTRRRKTRAFPWNGTIRLFLRFWGLQWAAGGAYFLYQIPELSLMMAHKAGVIG